MGCIHSRHRNRLFVGILFNTAVVWMSLKREHAAAGLTRARLDPRDEFAEETAEVDMLDENPDPERFTALAAQLQKDVDKDECEDEDDEAAPENTVPTTSKLQDTAPKRACAFFGT
ncbi:hypothetical protein FRC12_015383 [Ceratobasidium sp. 428]|nr:hypothetical protein FRC12_015383 [Ceratobasidium sp. 428]